MDMIVGYDLDRGGPKDSETAPFLTKTNGKGFWRFGIVQSQFNFAGLSA